MTDLSKQLANAKGSGCFHLIREPYEIEREAKQAGLHVVRMDIGHAHDKGEFIDHIAKALNFPATFGKNWDALNDSLTDLSWVKDAGKAFRSA